MASNFDWAEIREAYTVSMFEGDRCTLLALLPVRAWLNMAEIVLSVQGRRCLSDRIVSVETLE